MKSSTIQRVSGLVMLINTFLPIVVVVALILMARSTAGEMVRQACATAGQIGSVLNDAEARNAYLAANDDGERAMQLALLASSLRDTALEEPGGEAAPACLEKNLATVLGEELFGKTVGSIKEQAKQVQVRMSGVKSNLKKRIPEATPWTLEHVPVKGIARKLASGVNSVIDKVNGVPVSIRSGMVTLGDKVGDTIKWIFAPLSVADYQRAAAWTVLAGLLADAAKSLEKFYWFFAALAIWLLFSYLIWAQRRLSTALTLLRTPAFHIDASGRPRQHRNP